MGEEETGSPAQPSPFLPMTNGCLFLQAGSKHKDDSSSSERARGLGLGLRCD